MHACVCVRACVRVCVHVRHVVRLDRAVILYFMMNLFYLAFPGYFTIDSLPINRDIIIEQLYVHLTNTVSSPPPTPPSSLEPSLLPFYYPTPPPSQSWRMFFFVTEALRLQASSDGA